MSKLSSALGRLPRAWRGQAGFTLIEMLTVFLVVGVLTTLILVNTQTGDRRQELRDSAAEFVNAARNAESRAAAAQPVNGTSRKAYGVCVTSSFVIGQNRCTQTQAGRVSDLYQVYARNLSDSGQGALTHRPVNPDIISTHKLPKNFSFFDDDLYIDYVPPGPYMFANGETTNTFAWIIYGGPDQAQSKCNPGFSDYRDCKIIQIRPAAGAVYVQ